jgi:hypothetical protein
MQSQKPKKPKKPKKPSSRAAKPDDGGEAGRTSSAAVAAPLPGEGAVDSTLLDQAVAELNRRYAVKGLETIREIGEYVLAVFFDGEPENFRDRGNGHITFRQLGERDDLRVSYAFIWRAVSVVDQLRLLPEEVASALPPTHHTLLLGVKDTKKKQDLARQAVAGEWSKDRLQVAVTKLREKEKSAAGRPPLPAFVKAIHKLSKLLEGDSIAFGGLDKIDEIDEDEAARLYQTVTGMKLQCEALQKELERKVPGFGPKE